MPKLSTVEQPGKTRANTLIQHCLEKNFADINHQTPGVAFLGVQGGAQPAEYYAGLASLEHGVPITERTVFNLASISKILTATAIMLLVQERRLSLDASLADWFPSWRRFYAAVRVRHLLSHTSGLSGIPPKGLPPPRRFSTTYGNLDLVELLNKYHPPLRWPPGSRYEYCNIGFVLLAEIVEKLVSCPFAEFMNKRVFQPFGMRHAEVCTEHRPVIFHRAQGYGWVAAGKRHNTQNMQEYTTGDGGIFACTHDLYNFWKTLMGGRVLRPEFRDLMFRPVVNQPEPGKAYGLGWRSEHFGQTVAIGHTGTDAGFANTMQYFSDTDILIIILSNAAFKFPGNKRQILVRKIMDYTTTELLGKTEEKIK